MANVTYGNQIFYSLLGLLLGLGLISSIISISLYIRKRKKDPDSEEISKPQRGFAIFATLCVSLFLITLGTFNFYPWYAGAILITLLIGAHIYLTLSDLVHLVGGSQKKFYAALIMMSVVLIVVIFISTYLLSGICFGFHPDEISFVGSRLSTPDFCAGFAPKPCHFYLIFGANVSSQINVIFHSYTNYISPVLLYSLDGVNFTEVGASSRYFSLLAPFTYRYLYYASLDNLNPDTIYYLKVGDSTNSNSISNIKKFKTGPSSGEFTFAVGGDVGCEWPYPELTSQQVATREILFLALGGDISYGNGLPGCYHRWDQLLSMWEKTLRTPSGLAIPFIFAIGNHEAGVAWGSYDKKTAPYYFNYLPHEPITDGRDPESQSTYRYHHLSNSTVLYILDSDITLHSTEQVSWLTNLMGGIHASIPNKLALYHIPLYPGSRTLQTLPIPSLRETWLPIFDEYQLKVAFENHDHVFLRSHPLKNDQINENGTLYIGDGAFGVVGNLAADQRSYAAKTADIRHFMFVNIIDTTVNITVIGFDGSLIDNVIRN